MEIKQLQGLETPLDLVWVASCRQDPQVESGREEKTVHL